MSQRLAVLSPRKKLEAFLDLDLPGTKVIVVTPGAAIALEEAYPTPILPGRKARRGAGTSMRGRRLRGFPARPTPSAWSCRGARKRPAGCAFPG